MKRIVCRLRGHKNVCSQTVTLLADGRGIIDHAHDCMYCKRRREFPPEPLEQEFAEILWSLVGEENVAITTGWEPPMNHSDLLN